LPGFLDYLSKALGCQACGRLECPTQASALTVGPFTSLAQDHPPANAWFSLSVRRAHRGVIVGERRFTGEQWRRLLRCGAGRLRSYGPDLGDLAPVDVPRHEPEPRRE